MNSSDHHSPAPGGSPVSVSPELEARLVAWIAGEASPFEIAELERLVREQPAVATAKHALEQTHALLAAAATPDREPLRLSAERRAKLLQEISIPAEQAATTANAAPSSSAPSTPASVVSIDRAHRQRQQRRTWMLAAAASCALVTFLLVLDPTDHIYGIREATTQAKLEQDSAPFRAAEKLNKQEESSAAFEARQRKWDAERQAMEDPAAQREAKFQQEVLVKKQALRMKAPRSAPKPSGTLSAPPPGHPLPASASPRTNGNDKPLNTFDISLGESSESNLGPPLSADVRSAFSQEFSFPNAAPLPGDGAKNFYDDSKSQPRVPRGSMPLSATSAPAKTDQLTWGRTSTGTKDGPYKRSDPQIGDGAGTAAPATEESSAQVRAHYDEGYLNYADLDQHAQPAPVGGIRGLAAKPSVFSDDSRQRLEASKDGFDAIVVPASPPSPMPEDELRAVLKPGFINPAELVPVKDADASIFRAPTISLPSLEEISAEKTPVSTFSLHVGDVSFRLAQKSLAAGRLPDPATVRAEEFVNAFRYGDLAPLPAEKITARIEQAAHPLRQQRNLVRIAAKVPSTGRDAITPLRLTVLLDTSGSMEREDRAATVRAALESLATLLTPNDQLTLVGFSRTTRILADSVPGDQVASTLGKLGAVPSDGGTNLEEALRQATTLALRRFSPTAQNRVVLLTDGATNLGDARPEALTRFVTMLRENQIAFDACGVGLDGLDDTVLESLTRQGDGRYYVLDTPAAADAGFARQLAGAFRPAAANVKVQVRFNPARVGHYRLLGFEKHRLNTEDFRNDAVDAAELAADEDATAVYEVEARPEGTGELGEVFVRFRDTATNEMVERSWTMTYDARAPQLDRASPTLQLAGTTALFAQLLRDRPADLGARLAELAPGVHALRGKFPHDARVAEFTTMFEQARRIAGH